MRFSEILIPRSEWLQMRIEFFRQLQRAVAVALGTVAIVTAVLPGASASVAVCSYRTCTNTPDNGVYIGRLFATVTTGWTPYDNSGFYHVHLTGPGLDKNSDNEYVADGDVYEHTFELNRAFNPDDVICVQGWMNDRENQGRPCFTIER
ncbi:hypothetical protein F3087_26840 [Nocardia colli]|uniref:Uncharacterized protein n=1 Tax=Nocardia colli TaxID=2545717 RepID=A0A5N0ECH8_9NOCA|nr:hypothetical protein [Nocardia colli]KAA8886209.1 hypothetical protein F3087_26840 [Nocardia colli]